MAVELLLSKVYNVLTYCTYNYMIRITGTYCSSTLAVLDLHKQTLFIRNAIS